MAGKLPQSFLRSLLPGSDRSQKKEMVWRSCTTPGARHGPMGLASHLLPTGPESYPPPPPGQAIKSNKPLNIIKIKYNKNAAEGRRWRCCGVFRLLGVDPESFGPALAPPPAALSGPATKDPQLPPA